MWRQASKALSVTVPKLGRAIHQNVVVIFLDFLKDTFQSSLAVAGCSERLLRQIHLNVAGQHVEAIVIRCRTDDLVHIPFKLGDQGVDAIAGYPRKRSLSKPTDVVSATWPSRSQSSTLLPKDASAPARLIVDRCLSGAALLIEDGYGQWASALKSSSHGVFN